MGCCGQTKPLRKSVAQMQALKASNGFVVGQLYQIYDAHQASPNLSITLTACPGSANGVVALPLTLTGVTSGAVASWTSGGLTPATIAPLTSVFINGETVSASNGNCYIVSGVSLNKGAVLNIRAYSTSELEDDGFGTFINQTMGTPIYAVMKYDLSLDTVYKVSDRSDYFITTGRSEIEDILGSTNYVDNTFFDHITGINNIDKYQVIAHIGPVSGASAASTTVTQYGASFGNGIGLNNCAPTHFIVRWISGTFGAVVVSFKVNGVVVASGVSLAGITSTNLLVVPITAPYLKSTNPSHLIQVEVTSTVASTQFDVECYGIKNL